MGKNGGNVMSWFDILKKPLSLLIRDLEPDRNLLDIETKPRIFNPPPEKFRRKQAKRRVAVATSTPLKDIEEEGMCPKGMLWCEKHEECETEKKWLTHNAHPTKEDIQWGGGGKGPSGPKQQVATKVKTK